MSASHSILQTDPTTAACREALTEVMQLGVALTRRICEEKAPIDETAVATSG